MIKRINIVVLFFCCLVECLFAQNNGQHLNHTNKSIIRNHLYNIPNHHYVGRYLNILYFSDEYQDSDLLLSDSLKGPFIITNIVLKKDNFILKRNRLTKQVLYMVDVISIASEYSPEYICVIIPKNDLQKKKIEIGDTLKVTIYPLFWKNKFLERQGGVIYTSLPSLKTPHSLVFRNIWIESLQTSYRNYYFIEQSSNISNILLKTARCKK